VCQETRCNIALSQDLPFHDHGDGPVFASRQVSQGVLDVFELAELARPATGGQLSGRMLGNTLVVGKQGDSLECRLQRVVLTT
jgi:hypothetical protein